MISETNFFKGINSDFALQNVECAIYGKYRIYCQMDFMCEVQLPEFVRQHGTVLKGPEIVIASSFLEGFRTNYKIHEDDQEILEKLFEEHQAAHKETASKLEHRRMTKSEQGTDDYQRIKNYEEKRPMDIMQIEKFLYYFDLVDRYLNEQEAMKKRLEKMTNRIMTPLLEPPMPVSGRRMNSNRFAEVFKTAKAIGLSIMKESMTDMQKQSSATCFSSEDLCRGRILELTNMIYSLIDQLSSMELGFKGVETYLNEDKKMFIERDRYFIPLDMQNAVYDIQDERFLVNLNKGSDEEFFKKYQMTTNFIDQNRLDRQQQQWFRRQPIMVNYLRPVDKEEEGIFVDNLLEEMKRKKELDDLAKDFVYYKTIDL